MTREFNKPLNQMTDELFRYFWELCSRLNSDDSICECDDTDKITETININEILFEQKSNCSKMNQLADNITSELEKRTDLNEEWKKGYKRCVDHLLWLSSKLSAIQQECLLDAKQAYDLKQDISQIYYNNNTFVSLLQTITEYDFRYTKTEQDDKYFLQCVEIPEITITVSKKIEDESSMTGYDMMNAKILCYVKKFPEKAQQFEHNDTCQDISVKLITFEV